MINLEILIPSDEEQKAIAQTLSLLDGAIIMANQAIEKAEKIKLGLMQYLFNKRKRVDKWGIKELSNLCEEIKRGPFGGSIKKEIFVSHGYKVYEQKNIISNDFSLGKYYIDEKKYKEMSAFAIREDDILITGAGTIGKLAIVPKDFEPGIINQALIKIRVDKNKLLPEYLFYLFNHSDFQKRVLGFSHGATMKNISSVKSLKVIKLPIPPLDSQRKIISMLSEVDGKLLLENKRKTQYQLIKQGLINDLLTGRKRIKV